ncbi:MAG: glutamate ligase domain-containing protein, partial [Gemmatimonadota bacterium]
HGAPMVVNADDPCLSRVARTLGRPLTWIALDEVARVRAETGPTDVAWVVDAGWLVRNHGDLSVPLVEAEAIPATLCGAAAYNISNALGAAALAGALGLSDAAIRSGLVGFDPSPERSPGRGNLFDLGGVRVLVDFVHNPHGFTAMAKTADRLAPKRVGLMIGHAGDRDDESIQELVRAAWGLGPERVAIKELQGYLRGRALGEVPAIIRAELSALGARDDAISSHADEVAAARALLEWARAGDFLLLSSQSDRRAVLDLVESVRASGWKPGDEVPPS